MRAVLRCDIKGRKVSTLKSLYHAGDSKYEDAVVELFQNAGYKPICKHPGLKSDDPVVSAIFDHVPEDIKREELRRLVMTGYTSDGQAHFVVCAIHHNRLHVRTQAATFLRLSKSCGELYEKLPKLMGRIWWYVLGSSYLKLDPLIQVLEPKQELPTIMGKAIRGSVHAFLETAKRERVPLFLVVAGVIFVISVLYQKSWDWSQLYQAPIFPPLAVFIISNLMPILVAFGHYYFNRPIVWDNKIEDSL